jgi:hypothetical protein
MPLEEKKLYDRITYDANIYDVYVIKSSSHDEHIIIGYICSDGIYGSIGGLNISEENLKNYPKDFIEILKKVIK